jgi:hypothetical protein
MHTVAGFSASATLDRNAFGITAYGDSIGHDVSVWLELEAIRNDHAEPSATAQPSVSSPPKEQP